jgi:hypothetical protein
MMGCNSCGDTGRYMWLDEEDRWHSQACICTQMGTEDDEPFEPEPWSPEEMEFEPRLDPPEFGDEDPLFPGARTGGKT